MYILPDLKILWLHHFNLKTHTQLHYFIAFSDLKNNPYSYYSNLKTSTLLFHLKSPSPYTANE